MSKDDKADIKHLEERISQIEQKFSDSNAHSAELIVELEEKNAQLQNLSNIIEKSLNEVFIFDRETMKFTYCNEEAVRNTGYSREELMSLTPLDLKKEYNVEIFNSLIQPLLTKEKNQIYFNTTHARKDGTTYHAKIQLRLSEYKNKPVFFASIEDITQEHDLEQKLHLSAKLASLGVLAAGVGHEINNPLTIAIGFLEKLEHTMSFDEKSQKTLDKIKNSHQRIATIVSDLRVYSHTATDETVQTINLSEIVRNTYSLLNNIFKSENIDFNLKIDQENIFIIADLGRLQQILLNLLTNAKDAVKARKAPTITLSLIKSNNNVQIHVEDNGSGIPKDVLDKIFNPFFTTKAVGEGSGIGLGLVQSLVQKYKGEIDFHTEQDIGTTFKITFKTTEPNSKDAA